MDETREAKPRVRELTANCKPYTPRSAAMLAALSEDVDVDGPLYTLEEVEERRAKALAVRG